MYSCIFRGKYGTDHTERCELYSVPLTMQKSVKMCKRLIGLTLPSVALYLVISVIFMLQKCQSLYLNHEKSTTLTLSVDKLHLLFVLHS